MTYKPFRSDNYAATPATIATDEAVGCEVVAKVAGVAARPESRYQYFEERAAIIEFDGGLTRDHAEHWLHSTPCHCRMASPKSSAMSLSTPRRDSWIAGDLKAGKAQNDDSCADISQTETCPGGRAEGGAHRIGEETLPLQKGTRSNPRSHY